MALAFDQNRTIVRGINKNKHKHIYLQQKEDQRIMQLLEDVLKRTGEEQGNKNGYSKNKQKQKTSNSKGSPRMVRVCWKRRVANRIILMTGDIQKRGEMALAYYPNRTFVRGINKNKHKHVHFFYIHFLANDFFLLFLILRDTVTFFFTLGHPAQHQTLLTKIKSIQAKCFL